MKSLKSFAYVAAIALVSVSLASCKDKNPVEGNYNGEVVKTEFSIAVPTSVAGGNGAKRMKGTTAQVDAKTDATKFRGISNLYFVPFADKAAVVGGSTRLGDNISQYGNPATDMTVAAAATEITKNSGNAKSFNDVSIPLTTSSFLVYAKAIDVSSDKFENGSLTASITADNPSDFSFSLEQIYPTASDVTASTALEGLCEYLTNIASAEDDAATPNKWYEYADMTDVAVPNVGMKQIVAAYLTYHHLNTFNVERMLTDLNKSMKPLTSTLATNIKNAINNSTYATISGDEVQLVAAYKNFPDKLPANAVLIEWNATGKKFQHAAEATYTSKGMSLVNNYVYPSSLWYYGNSTIQTSNTSQKAEYEVAANTWSTILGKHTDGTSVATATRAVAVKDPIQYGVGRLDVYVKTNDVLKDADPVEANRDKTVGASGFELSAVLVGGQKNVGFDFTPLTSPTEYTIYDKDINSTNVPKSSSFATAPNNYTLVLENDKDAVYIAIELTNNLDVDFYGADGIIPNGGKFYLVGQLNASSKKSGSLTTVFKQDYFTIAKLTVTKLSSAYNTIPDLRTPQLELGLSVDLEWQEGNLYEVDL